MSKQKNCFVWCLLIAACYDPTFRTDSPPCGNGQIEEDELCDDGSQNGMYGFCNADCSSLGPRCGDGKTDNGEQCDDGSKNGMYGFCNIDCLGPASYCGDGLVDETEECDDANFSNLDICLNSCKLASCGDGYVHQGVEECDDGNTIGGDGCESDCSRTLKEVVAGGGHTCVRFSNGNVRCWGLNNFGQLGDGNPSNNRGDELGEMPPDDIKLLGANDPEGTKVNQIVAGQGHTCALLSIGDIRCWGYNVYGQLGYGHTHAIGDQPDEMPPLNVPIAKNEEGLVIKKLAVGQHHTCVLGKKNASESFVRCWGLNTYGQLGYDNKDSIGNGQVPMPPLDVNLGEENVKDLALGYYHTCALFEGGDVSCWGQAAKGQLGYGDFENDIGDQEGEMPPQKLDLGGKPVTKLAAGYTHTCALFEDGNVQCWGRNDYGQLGYSNAGKELCNEDDGDICNDHKNCCIGDEPGEMPLDHVDVGGKVVQIAAGQSYTCALLDSGKIRCWGYNVYGQLGYGHTHVIGDDLGEMPPPDVDLGGLAKQITVGPNHTCALLESGFVHCWGSGNDGCLGYGNKNTIGNDETPSSVGFVPIF